MIVYNINIIREGLILHLDAANVKSYPGSGSTWYDLSPKKFDVTLYNSPSYTEGKLSFNGVDTYGEIDAGLKSVVENATNFTIITFVNIKYIEHVDNLVGWGNANIDDTGYSRTFGQYAAGGNLRTSYTGPTLVASTDPLGVNVCLVSRYDDHVFYANSFGPFNNADSRDYTGSTSVTWKGISTSYPITVAKTSYFGRYMEVDVGSIQMYNRFLSDAEIKQNFEAFRGRYGI